MCYFQRIYYYTRSLLFSNVMSIKMCSRYDCSCILHANMNYEEVSLSVTVLIKRCNIVVTRKPCICGVFQTRMISACKTKSVTHGFGLNSTEGTSQNLYFWQILNMCKISTSFGGAFFLGLFMICMHQYSATGLWYCVMFPGRDLPKWNKLE